MNKLTRASMRAALACALSLPAAHAELVQDPAALGSALVAGFDELIVPPGQPNGPVDVGAGTGYRVFATSAGGSLSLGEAPAGVWGLGSNGMWTLGQTFAGVDGGVDETSGAASLTFDFGGLSVRGVGGFLNYDPDFVRFGIPETVSISAYDHAGTELDSWFLPIDTAEDSINDGTFFGILLDAHVIARFTVYGPYAVIDDLTFSQPVPEPTTYVLLLTSLGIGAALLARRRSFRE
jgi:hypothetical protein